MNHLKNKMKILFLLLNRGINLANIRYHYPYKLISFSKIYKLNFSPILKKYYIHYMNIT